MISAARREDIVSALRRGTVPSSGLDALEITATKIAGFIGCRLQYLPVPNCTAEVAELTANLELKDRALTFGAQLAAARP